MKLTARNVSQTLGKLEMVGVAMDPAGGCFGFLPFNKNRAERRKLISKKESSNSQDGAKKKNKNKKKTAMLGEYTCVRLVGTGSFGKVFLAKDEESVQPLAIKVIPKGKLRTPRRRRLMNDEKDIMIRCRDHPFILTLHHCFQTSSHVCMVMDFCQGGELFYSLAKHTRFSEDIVRFYASEIISALTFLHENRVAYRDLKTENLLLDAHGHIKLTDFGLATYSSEFYGAKSICGTPTYIAPEIVQHGGRGGQGYGYAVDWWSLGTLMYDMLVGVPPFLGRDLEGTIEEILTGRLWFPPKIMLSRDVEDVIRGLLDRNPEYRLGTSLIGGVNILKQHPFFRSVDWDNLETVSDRPAELQIVSCSDDMYDTTNFSSEFTAKSVTSSLSDANRLVQKLRLKSPNSGRGEFKDWFFRHESETVSNHSSGKGDEGGLDEPVEEDTDSFSRTPLEPTEQYIAGSPAEVEMKGYLAQSA
mmetsp:Transcript_19513/g.32580  ORF Transcript_19513/g.32580 Transcript_19513/m.32580 type:complete len:472 (+) Transcript_19513:303-1718(+)